MKEDKVNAQPKKKTKAEAKPKVDAKAKGGFASMPEDKAEAIRAKGHAGLRKYHARKREVLDQALALRKQADELINQAEGLREQADDMDGEFTSKRSKKKYEAELFAEIDEMYAGTVEPRYLKQLKHYALEKGLTAQEIVTPSKIQMDILHDPQSTIKERTEAAKALAMFENPKPIGREEVEEGIGSVQDEITSVLDAFENMSPKRET